MDVKDGEIHPPLRLDQQDMEETQINIGTESQNTPPPEIQEQIGHLLTHALQHQTA